MELQYRTNDYFNDKDQFLFVFNWVNGTYNYVVAKVEFYNGNWYMLAPMQYKCTAVRCINCSELKIII